MITVFMSNVSNRLNEVMKVLTIIAAIFGSLAVATGLFGMNVDFPRHSPGRTTAPFWLVVTSMLAIGGSMLVWFRKRGWW